MGGNMIRTNDLHPEYITDEKGERKSVILSVSAYEELLQDLEDLAAVAERREEETISHNELLSELKNNDLI